MSRISAASSAAASPFSDGGLAVVRIKPLGAGGGGGERSATSGRAALHATSRGIRVGDSGGRSGGNAKVWTYPQHVIAPEDDQEALYEKFVPQRIDAFLDGYPVNICCYGQTGSGKTHTMFGPPGLMARAAAGEFGDSVCPDYGLFPRGLLDIVHGLREKKRGGGSLHYYLTASSVELSAISGNMDMFVKSGLEQEGSASGVKFTSSANGVCLDKTVKPPLMFGMVEVEIDPDNALDGMLKLFTAIASRNTAATGMNDSSSRSHCFVWLTLHAYDADGDRVRVSRFQFADLAGSERMRDAHVGFSGAMNAMALGNLGAVEGMCTNYGLMMLSQRVRELVSMAKRGASSAQLVAHSYKTQLDPDLIVLLSESLTGAALSLVIVCVSAAGANASQSVNALGFGQAFSGLRVCPRKSRFTKLATLEKKARELIASGRRAGGGANPKYAVIREAQGRQGAVLMGAVKRFRASR